MTLSRRHGERSARRRDGEFPPHVVVYLVMALALFADEDYQEVVERLTGALRSWGSWDLRWEPPTKGAVTQARQRLGPEPMAELFSQVAEPVAGLEAGDVAGPVAADVGERGRSWTCRNTQANREAFGTGANDDPSPKVRLVTVCGSGQRAPGAGRDGPVGRQGQRRAVPHQDPLPAAGGRLAAARGPPVLQLGRLARRRRIRR